MRRRRLLAALLLACACSKPAPKAPARAAAASPAIEGTSSSAGESWESLPARDAYAGSITCKECHEKNHTRWTHDWHARALQRAERGNVAGRFDGAHYKGESTEAWMTRHGDRFLMRTRDRSGQLHDYPVAWVIGGKRMQDAATVFDDGRWQVLPVYYHVTGGGAWVDYNESKQGKVGPDHPYFWTNFRRTSNKECLDCHATGLDVRYDRLSRRWSTSFADAGVAGAVARLTGDAGIREARAPPASQTVVADGETGGVAVEAFLVRGAAEVRPEVRMVGAYLSLLALVVVDPGPAARDEIGRASCRERV